MSQFSRKKLHAAFLFGLLIIPLFLNACWSPETEPPSPTTSSSPSSYQLVVPLGLDVDSPSFSIPAENPLTEAKIKLGKQLFFEKALSLDQSLSCASCHLPERGFGDPRPLSFGVRGRLSARHAPVVLNRVFSRKQFWDGRADSLEAQALGPMSNPVEMAHPDIASVITQLKKNPAYVTAFNEAFPTENGVISDVTIGRAIASFERTILTGNSAYDRFANGDRNALTPAAFRGYQLFVGKAACVSCHIGFNFTDESYHNLGISFSRDKKARPPDLGRYAITKLEGHQGAFKTPTLREIANTAPYMSNGSLKTLEEVIDFYNRGGNENPWLSAKIKPLGLTSTEKQELVEFLHALSGEVTWYGKEGHLAQKKLHRLPQ